MKKGLVHIYCGDGKGKTTCATGLAVRCAGGNGKVLWFQFMKPDTSGERVSLEKLEHIKLIPGYSKVKFSYLMTEEEKEEARAFYSNKLTEIAEMVRTEAYDLLILDEIIGSIGVSLISEDEVIEFLKNRPVGLEVVLTGRNPSKRLTTYADYISDIRKVKHPFDQNIPSRKLIEY